jgi:N-formylglutamate amidohydrolase
MRNRNKPHDPYEPEVLARLRDFYRPYNEELADYLGMDLDWNEQAAP